MSELSPESFACGACGQQYRWKPELAGKKAKCKCGQTMIVPPSGGRVAAAPATGTAGSTAAVGGATAKSSGVAGPAAAAGTSPLPASAAGSRPVPQGTPAPPPPIAQAAPAPAPAVSPPAPVAPTLAATNDAPGEDDMYALAGEDRGTSAAKPAKSATTAAAATAAPPARAAAPAAASSTGDDIDDMYALSEDTSPARAAKSPALARPAPVATAAAAPVAASSAAAVAAPPASPAAAGILGYVGTGKKEVQEEGVGSGLFRDLYLPIILVVSGILISVLHTVLAEKTPLLRALPTVGILLFVNLVLMFLGCMAAIKMMDIAFGDPLQAILKMCAILIGPGAVGTVAAYAVGGGFPGMALAIAVSLASYYALFMVFFDLDLTEVLLLCGILTVTRLWLGMLVGGLLVGLILGSDAAPAGVMMGMAGAGALGASSAATTGDQRPQFSDERVLRAAQQFAEGEQIEARKWLAENAGDVIAGYQRPGSVKFVEDLYAMGATSVRVTRFAAEDRAVAGLVGIMLPSGKKEREKLFAWHKQYAETRWIRGYLDDQGQKCIVVFMDDAMKRPDDEASKLDEDPVLLADAAAEEMLMGKRGKTDPTKWTANGDVKLYGISRPKSVQIVRELQQLGAAQITATGNVADRDESTRAAINAYTSLVVKLPEQPGSRKALFNWYAEYASRHPGQVFMEDHGQKYIVLDAGPESATPVTPRTLGSTQPSAADSSEVGDDDGEDEEE